MNLERLGNGVFNFLKTVTSKIKKSNNDDIKFESKLVDVKYDNEGTKDDWKPNESISIDGETPYN